MNGVAAQSDSRNYYKVLAALMWVALPLNGLLYAFWWGRLPARLATHFNFNNQPNGWMTREESLIFSLVIALVMVITASLVLSKIQKPDLAAWALLALFYVILGTLLSAEQSLIAYNVSGTPV